MPKILLSLILSLAFVLSPIASGFFADKHSAEGSDAYAAVPASAINNIENENKTSVSLSFETENTDTAANAVVLPNLALNTYRADIANPVIDDFANPAGKVQVSDAANLSELGEKQLSSENVPAASGNVQAAVSDKPTDNLQTAQTVQSVQAASSEISSQADSTKQTDIIKQEEKTKQTGSTEQSAVNAISDKPVENQSSANSVENSSAPVAAVDSGSAKQDDPAQDGRIIDTSKTGSGIIGIRYANQTGKNIKLLVEKDGKKYTYNLKADNSLETFPLQSGNGDYKVSILENIEGKRYKYIHSETIHVTISNSAETYLSSIQMINWNSDMKAIRKAAELTSGISSDEEKVKRIYSFVVENIVYDYNKLEKLPSTYLPVIDDTLATKSGICYDFASLTAAMLRSVGVPTKLVMGYADGVNGYHSWNEVYFNGKWNVIDTSSDAQLRENKLKYSMTKNTTSYNKEKEY